MLLSKKKTKPEVGDITITYDPATSSTTTTVQTAYDKMVTIGSTSATNVAWGTSSGAAVLSTSTINTAVNGLKVEPQKSSQEKEEERRERLEELSASLENLIADFLPESDKDIPIQIAKAVVNHIFNEGNVAPLLIDAKGYRESESKLIQNFQNMTMEEYAKIRPKIMKGVMT